MDFSTFKQLPRQAIPDSKKDEQWGKDCVDACEGLVLLENQGLINKIITIYIMV